MGDEVNRLRGAAGKNDFGGMSGIDKPSGPGASRLKAVSRAHGQGMKTAVNVGVVAFVITGQRSDHTPGLVSGCAVIEINEGLATDELIKRREVEADVRRK